MLKQALLIGAAVIGFPALAQVTDPADTAPPAPEQTDPAPVNSDPMTAPPAGEPGTDPTPEPMPEPTTPPADPMNPEPTPTDPMQPAPTEPAPPAGEVAQTPPADAAATPAQISQIVEQEFPTYDGDATGELNEAEFSAWMKTLRTATEPGIDPESEQVKTWVGQAFAAADADKSGSVTKDELTGFLSRGA